ncbi:MAG: amidohydrolase family protein, partial [Candidatus Sericytochromatia bacterium]
PDLCHVNDIKDPKDYLGRFWVDSLVHEKDALKDLIRIYGEDKVILGSDYPFPLGEDVPGTLVESMAFGADLKARLLSGNALEWLQRPKATYLRAA